MKRFWPTIIIVVLAVIVIGWLGRQWLGSLTNPLIALSRSSYLTIVRPLETLTGIFHLSEENKRLEGENSELKARISRLESVISDSQEMSRQLDALDKVGKDQVISAKVIGSSASPYQEFLRIDAGRQSGISRGQAVLASGHLIGQIENVYGNWSEVMLINNYNLVLPVKTQKSNQTGIIRGGVAGLILDDVPLEPKLQIDETVKTSGLEGEIPPDLPIGEINSLESNAGDIFQRARISSPVNLNQLQIVLVIYR